MTTVTNSTTKGRRHRRRGSGEGTTYQRPDGRWIGQLMIGYRTDGKRDIRSVSGKTRAETQRKLDELRTRAAHGMIGDAAKERETVTGFLMNWLQASKATVRLSTYQQYESLVRIHLLPALGTRKLRSIRPDDIQRLYGAKLAELVQPGPGRGRKPRTYSAKTVHHLHTIIHRAFGQAVKWGYLSRNPADAVDPPAVARKEMNPPSPTDLVALIDSANEQRDRLAALWTIGAYSGCRQAELLGLKWEDVDLDAGTITVRRILSGVRDCMPIYGEPKTSKSRRTVAVPREAVATLRAHKARQLEERLAAGPTWADYGLVFGTHLGTPLHRRNVLRAYKRALALAGLPARYTFHDLRHAHATLMLRAGVSMKIASERLGHSAIGITMDLYTHAIQAMDIEAAELVERALRGQL